MKKLQRALSLAVLVVGGCGDTSPAPSTVSRSSVHTNLNHLPPATAAIALGAAPFSVDAQGIPQLLRFTNAPMISGATATDIAIAHVERMLPAWGATSAPELVGIGEVAVDGGTIVRLQQRIDDIPVDREVRVFVKTDGGLHAISGAVISADAQRTSAVFHDTEQQAIATAVTSELKTPIEAAKLHLNSKKDGMTLVSGASNGITVSQASAKRVWFVRGGSLMAAWSIDAYAGRDTEVESAAFHVTLATDGRVLARRSLQADAGFQYRVYADTANEKHPFDSPLADYTPNTTGVSTTYPTLVNPALVTVDGLDMHADPWLPAAATTTSGNNVMAYTDANPPDGLGAGDFYADVTSTGVFDRTYDFTKIPTATADNQKVGITATFYTVNWLHDFWYDHGFTETAGNAQLSNYGRGGVEGDPMHAEAQDNALGSNGGSKNNANMSTPDDGMSPRLQIYVWTGKQNVALTEGARTPQANVAAFGPTTFNITGVMVLANDGTGTTTDACEALPAATGKIVVVDRGTCSFKTKALNVQTAGGIGMVLANNADSASPPSLGDDATITTAITIGVLSVTKADGTLIKGDIDGTATVTLNRAVGAPDLDGDLDASVISHEFGHYLHHRLSSCNSQWCGAMSEGWGDFDALMFTYQDGNATDAAYPLAVYSAVATTTAPIYFGIRRSPYSTDMTKNALMFHHMGAAAVLPTTAPIVAGGANNEVHNAGEVWANTMFEAYMALQHAGTNFAAVRTKMANYVVGGLLIAPVDNMPTEMRDAILTAAVASSPADASLMAQAFAKRGMGTCAVDGVVSASVPDPRYDTNFNDIVESTVTAGKITSATTLLAASTSCDNDGVIDNNESGTITLPVANTGAVALQNLTITITTTTPGVTLTDATTTVASLDAGATLNVTAKVALDNTATAPVAGDFTATLAADNTCDAQAITLSLPLRMNVDDVAASSATDTFDAGTTVWTSPATFTGWQHVRPTALDGKAFGPDLGGVSDERFESPELTGNATGNVTMSFTHTYDFEKSDANYDGGVIEYTIDGGTTWNDITMLGVTPGYATDGAIFATAGNPLAGRTAYAGKNPANPATDNVTLDFGTQLANKTFQVRFRVGTDAATGAGGWMIDNVAFTGITTTPFPTQVVDANDCIANPMNPDGGMGGSGSGSGVIGDGTNDDGLGCCSSAPLRGTSALMAFGVLGLVLRRRRR
ncbi:MAG: M36 family metallopeptidase [Kofleriaceae bacterium]